MPGSTVCEACGAENPAEAKFCGSCGTAQARACSRCGHANPPTGSFCLECGAALAFEKVDARYASPSTYTPPALADKIRADAAELVGERKLITVLFADVAGFTSIAERLDPEETRSMMQRAFAVMLDDIHRYEGTVSQLLGDGLLALFGAPIAHEDHAQRAIRAGLGIQVALRELSAELAGHGIDFGVRIGLHSGPVVFGHVGTDLEFSLQAVGDTVNTASRVQGFARSGSVVMSQSTYRLAEGYFVVEDLGEHEAKGKAQPLHLYEVVRPSGSRSRVDVSVGRGLGPFVGRAIELDILDGCLKEMQAGRGQVVFVSGEAGIGKSRLLHEARERVPDSEPARWLTGRCVSYGADISYVPIIDLLRSMCGIDESDGEVEIDQKLTTTIGSLGADASHLPHLRSLLRGDAGGAGSIALDPQLRKARLFEAVRDVVLPAAERAPVVIAIEDLHWIDPLSAELVSFIADDIADRPAMLVLTHRPDWDAPFGERPNVTRVELRTLTEPETARVAVSGTDGAELPVELNALIFRKAEGNPFFIEEVTRSLLEAGVLLRTGSGYQLARSIEDVDVPDTVHDVIMARLDRLPDGPRRALQTASVIGREFTARLLDRTARLGPAGETSLRELKSVQLIFERSLYPELVYMFKHALTHDVAYASLLMERRRSLHGMVADAMRDLYADRLSELHESLAYHYERAERWPEAVEFLTLAAEKSMQAAAVSQAATYCTRALSALARIEGKPDETLRIGLSQLRGRAFELLNDWDAAVDSYQGWLDAARRLGDRAEEGAALASIAVVLAVAHSFDSAMQTADQAERIADETNDDASRMGALVAKLLVLSVTGEIDATRTVFEELDQLAGTDIRSDVQATALDMIGELRHWMGDERGAIDRLDEVLAYGREHGSATTLIWVLWDRGLSLCNTGNYEEALSSLLEHLALCERIGDRFWRSRCENTLGWLYFDIGDLEAAIRWNRDSVETALAFGDAEVLRNAQLNLADCLLARGEPAEAHRLLEELENAIAGDTDPRDEWMKWRYRQHLHAGRSAAWLAMGNADEALACADRCIEEAEATSAPRNVIKGRIARAGALLALGRAGEAELEAGLAVDLARLIPNPAQIRRASAMLGATLAAQDRDEDAAVAYRSALDSIEEVAASLSNERARATFLASEEVVRIRDRR